MRRRTGHRRLTAGLYHKIAAAATVAAFAVTSTPCQAASINTIIANILKATRGFTDLISLTGYMCGAAMAGFGIFKLKQHVDAPGSVPMREGLIRLLAGGMLLSLPFMLGAMQGSVSNGSTTGMEISKLENFSGPAAGLCDLGYGYMGPCP